MWTQCIYADTENAIRTVSETSLQDAPLLSTF